MSDPSHVSWRVGPWAWRIIAFGSAAVSACLGILAGFMPAAWQDSCGCEAALQVDHLALGLPVRPAILGIGAATVLIGMQLAKAPFRVPLVSAMLGTQIYLLTWLFAVGPGGCILCLANGALLLATLCAELVQSPRPRWSLQAFRSDSHDGRSSNPANGATESLSPDRLLQAPPTSSRLRPRRRAVEFPALGTCHLSCIQRVRRDLLPIEHARQPARDRSLRARSKGDTQAPNVSPSACRPLPDSVDSQRCG